MGLRRFAQAGRGDRDDEGRWSAMYQRNDVEEWFLRRGMPTVARSSSSFRNTLLRASPVLFGFTIFYLLVTAIDLVWRSIDADTYASDDLPAWYLAAAVGAFAVAILAGWMANRYVRRRALRVRDVELMIVGVPLALVLLPVLDAIVGVESEVITNLLGNLTLMVVVIGMTKLGVGAIFVWSIRQALSQGMALTSMAARALPLILLVTLFAFLTDGMWAVTSSLSRSDLWAVVTILLTIAGGFVLVVIRDEMKTMLRGTSCTLEEIVSQRFPAHQLNIVERQPGAAVQLTRWETINATAILLIS